MFHTMFFGEEMEETWRGNRVFLKVYHIFIGMKFKDEGSLLRGNSTP